MSDAYTIKKMSIDDQKTAVECVMYILNKTAGTDIYHLLKELYYAERYHLATYGSRMIYDDFRAIDYGPVPSGVYDAIKGKSNANCPQMLKLVSSSVKRAGDDASNFLLPMRDADLSYLSQSMIDSLNHAISEVGSLSFEALKNKSHDAVWKSAFDKGKSSINYLDMAKAEGATDSLLAYIEDSEKLKQYLER